MRDPHLQHDQDLGAQTTTLLNCELDIKEHNCEHIVYIIATNNNCFKTNGLTARQFAVLARSVQHGFRTDRKCNAPVPIKCVCIDTRQHNYQKNSIFLK